MWKKLPAIEGGPFVIGCANARPIESVAPMDLSIGVGFGIAQVTRDNIPVYDESEDVRSDDDYWTTQQAEHCAAMDPDHDWRIVMEAPLCGQIYQRHAPGKWVLIEKNKGFA